jgi:hypothetical protein
MITCTLRLGLAIAVIGATGLVSGFAAGANGPQSLRDFARVVIADDALPGQKTAAEELAHYAGKIAGTKIAIVPWSAFVRAKPAGLSFFVGEGAAAKATGDRLAPWRTEEWLIRSLPNGIALAGHDNTGDAWSASTPAGTMLAVYTLLDDYLGVHWFWPGPAGEHVPVNPTATVPYLNLRQTPAFSIRSIKLGYPTYHNTAFKDAERKWARRSRLAWVRSAIFGHSWDAAFDLRKGETFKAHPEWFALVGGQRRPPQMCTTHPDVIARMVEYVLKGKQDIMNISPSDGGGFCECDRCRALDVPGLLAYDGKHVQLSDRIFTYANEVARRVRAQSPDKGCGMFAYTFYNRPPVKITKLEPNLWLSFVFQSAAHRNPENLREWRDNVAGWKHLGARMVVREGWGNHYYHDLPFLHYNQIAHSLAEAHQLGFTAAYGEGSKNFATMAPNFWAITRLMWDPSRDRAQLMPEFYRSAYGPAAAEMEAFFETYNRALDANWSKMARNVDTNQIAYANITASWHELLPASVVEAAEGHLRAAERAATAGEYADRVRFHRLGQDYARLMLELLDSYRKLAGLGLKLDTFSAIFKGRREDPAARAALLRRTFDLGEQREKLLLAQRDQAGPDEGLYAYTNDAKLRQWHAAVKQELGLARPSSVTKATLEQQ